MKRINMLLGVVLSLFMFGPTIVKAEKVAVNSSSVPAGQYGIFAAGDITYEYTNTANGTKVWEFYLTPSSNITHVYILLNPINLEIENIQAGNSFTLLTQPIKTSEGTKVLLQTNSATGLNSSSRVLLFTVTTKDTGNAGDACQLNPSPLNLNCLKFDDGYFFDNNGKQVNSQEEQNAVCETINTPKDEKNPGTGNVIPYIAITGGLIAIAGAYFFSKKTNKMYKI